MSEILSASRYQGEGAGIGARFVGLAEGDYDELSIAVAGGAFVEVKRDEEIPFMSTIAAFGELNQNEIYQVLGRVRRGGGERVTECLIPAREAFVERFGPYLRHGGALGAFPPEVS